MRFKCIYVPNLRFDNNSIFRCSTIKEESDFVKDGTHGTHANVLHGIPLLSAKDILDGVIDINSNPRLVSIEDFQNIYKKFKPQEEDILITIVGTVGKIAMIPKNFPCFAFQRSIGWIRFKDYLNKKYLLYLLQSNSVQNEINLKINASAQGGIYLQSLEKIKIYIPNIAEQQKVANFLQLIDQRIQTQSKIIEELITFKYSIYNHLFNNLTDNLLPLSDLCQIIKGQQVNGDELINDEQYYFLNGGIEPSGMYNKFNVEENTISISEGGNSCGFVNLNKEKFWSGGHCYTLQNLNNEIINDFLFHYLKYKENDIMKLRVGSGLPNIQKKDLAQFKIPVPALNKQVEIKNVLNTIENKIIVEKKLLEKQKEQKKYLLSNMFI